MGTRGGSPVGGELMRSGVADVAGDRDGADALGGGFVDDSGSRAPPRGRLGRDEVGWWRKKATRPLAGAPLCELGVRWKRGRGKVMDEACMWAQN